jgi:uncharacterized protein with GYD domain
MATFFMFGKYSTEALKGISKKRTEQAIKIIKKFGGERKGMYLLLGEVDIVGIVDFPGVKDAMQASVALSRLTGLSITTSPAVTAKEFDKMMAEL